MGSAYPGHTARGRHPDVSQTETKLVGSGFLVICTPIPRNQKAILTLAVQAKIILKVADPNVGRGPFRSTDANRAQESAKPEKRIPMANC
jgi:hypothetical protein